MMSRASAFASALQQSDSLSLSLLIDDNSCPFLGKYGSN